MKRETNEATCMELLGLFEAKKRIKREMAELKQAYTWEWDDGKAEEIRREWRELRKELRKAEAAITEFAASL